MPHDTMSTRAIPAARPDEAEELALIDALGAMLRDKRKALLDGDMSAQALAALWQPLLDRLQPFAARRIGGRADAPSPRLLAQVDALRQEHEALQHTLQLWSGALRVARDKSAHRPSEPVYGRAPAQAARGSLGRG